MSGEALQRVLRPGAVILVTGASPALPPRWRAIRVACDSSPGPLG